MRAVTESSLWSKRENQISVLIMKKGAVPARSSYNLDVSKVTQLVDCRHFRGFGGRKLTREAAMILFIPIVASVLTITSVDYLMMFWLPFCLD